MSSTQKILRHGYRIGSATTFAVPILLNLLISTKLSIVVAADWLTTMAFAAMLRSMINSKAMDVVLRFASYAGREKLTAVLRWALFIEFFFSLLQSIALFFLIRLSAPDIPVGIQLFSAGFMILTNLRDILYAYVRQRFRESAYYRGLWIDAILRISSLSILVLGFERFWPWMVFFVLGPMAFYPVLLAVGAFQKGTRLDQSDVFDMVQFSFISQGGSLLKASYQNIDVFLAPMFLADAGLWMFLTARQLFMQALSMSVMPIINSTIPTLISRFKTLDGPAFLTWLSATRGRILQFSLINLSILWPFGVAWMEFTAMDRLDYIQLFAVFSIVGIIRTNLWWNRDSTYFFDRYFQIRKGFMAGFFVWISIGVGFLLSSISIVLIGQMAAFCYISIISFRFIRSSAT